MRRQEVSKAWPFLPAWAGALIPPRADRLVQSMAPPAARMGAAVLQFIATVFIARTMGEAESGQFFFWSSVLMSAGQVATFGLDRLALRQVPRLKGKEAISAYLGPIRLVSLALAVFLGVLFVPYAALAQKAQQHSPGWYLLLPACIAGVALCKINGEVAKGLGYPTWSIIYRFVLSGALFLLAIVAAGGRLSEEIALTAYTGSFVVAGFAALWGPGFRGLGPHLRLPRLPEIRQQLAEGLPICIASIFAALNFIFPLAMLERSHPPETVAHLITAYRLFILFELLGVAIHSINLPRLSLTAGDQDWRDTRQVYRASVRQGMILLGLPMLLAIAIAPQLMAMFGEGFGEAHLILRVFLVFGLFTLLLGPASDLVLMIGHVRSMASYTLVRLVQSAVLAMILVPWFGAMGAAIALGAGALLEKILCLHHFHRHSKNPGGGAEPGPDPESETARPAARRRVFTEGRLPWVLGGFAVLYLALVVCCSPDQLRNDEPRYFSGALHLSNGYFVPPGEPDFTNGPGYPALLTPLVKLLGFEDRKLIQDPATYEFFVPDANGAPIPSLKWRLLPLRLLNVAFLVAGLYLLYRTARLFVSPGWALLAVLLAGLNPHQLRWVPMMMTESITPFFFCGFAYAYVRSLREPRLSWKWILLAAAAFFALAMIRTLFGYVATAALLVLPVFCLIDRFRHLALRSVLPLAAALLFCLPYLAYTYHHTGKAFCWATNGMELAYWMTSPHSDEQGNWLQLKWVEPDPVLAERHLTLLREIQALPVRDREHAWAEAVSRNLAAEGVGKALLRHSLANVSRAFFNVPRTRNHDNLAKVVWILNGALFLALATLAAWAAVRKWRAFPVSLKLLLLLSGIYFGGSLVLPTETRYFIPVLPAVLLAIAFAFQHLLQIRVRLSDPATATGSF